LGEGDFTTHPLQPDTRKAIENEIRFDLNQNAWTDGTAKRHADIAITIDRQKLAEDGFVIVPKVKLRLDQHLQGRSCC
jgi:hypothetical protein